MFLTWAGDHSPRHVHVYRARDLRREVGNLENWQAMKGQANAKLKRLLEEIVSERVL